MIRKLKCGIEQRAGELIYKIPSQDGYVLMFHDVSNEYSKDRNIWISTDIFSKLLDVLKNRENIIDISKINEEKGVILTFDDAFIGCYTDAYPLLKMNKIPFTVFISGEFIGKQGYLTEEMIREMAEDPLCTIGSHLYHHVMTRDISEYELKHEINENNFKLQLITEKKIRYMAFPYGSSYAVSRANMIYARKYFDLVFTTWKTGYNELRVKKTKIVPRLSVNEELAGRYLDGKVIKKAFG